MEFFSRLFRRVKLYLAMILLQFGSAGMTIIAKFVLNRGMSHYVLVAYRMAVATAVMAPFAVVLERQSRPKMTFSILLKAMLLSLFDPLLDQNLYYIGMTYTGASFASSMNNILPALAFATAWIFGFEKVNIRRFQSQAKILGTIVVVGGVMLMTLIQGRELNLPWTKGRSDHPSQSASATNKQDLMKGSLLIIASCFCWCCFIILQAITLRSYPAQLSLTTLICSSGMVEAVMVSLAFERGNAAVWSVHLEVQLLASLYAGILSGVAYYIMGVVTKEKGPVFLSAFNPLTTIVITILGSFVLAEKIYLGRIIGVVIIFIGLYVLLWGKRRDQLASQSNTGSAARSEQQMSTPTPGECLGTSDHAAITVSSVVRTDETV
ncbi:WAT1-related protein At2g39510-like isoform X2 [Juglans microcarpa x Juglans regia]|uniref:WAT1-related protein At2g39510-like isoform X2 n=1 Tax=Juglans microcarpa x Juglans regia TaxID=2249226 RepID=UPI001B7F62A3|nr:WAT1-related protein At2g39510-like isoform X2 [Juglans microcarpa x Juglans regia]